MSVSRMKNEACHVVGSDYLNECKVFGKNKNSYFMGFDY